MVSVVRLGSVAAASALVFSFTTVSAGAAEACVPGAEVRERVHSVVAGLREDVPSASARSALAEALVDALRAARGVDADTAAERKALGEQIKALRAELAEGAGKVEREALRVDIKALVEMRERGAFTAVEREAIREALDNLRQAVVAKTDRRAEDRGVSALFKALGTHFGGCHA
jgi:hypothetical protein